MDEYISREATIDAIKKIYCPQCNNYNGAMCRACEHMDDMDIIEDMPAANLQLVISGDNCIVCGRDVRKDNVYYDVNGGTICESCMNTKCKCKNEGAKNE